MRMQCLCGKTTEHAFLKTRVIRRADGKRVTFTDVPAEICPGCKEVYFTPEASAIMLRLGETSPCPRIPFPSSLPLTAEEVQHIRQALHLSQVRLGNLLGLSPTSVALWEQGRRKPDGPSRVLLRLMAALGPFEGAGNPSARDTREAS